MHMQYAKPSLANNGRHRTFDSNHITVWGLAVRLGTCWLSCHCLPSLATCIFSSCRSYPSSCCCFRTHILLLVSCSSHRTFFCLQACLPGLPAAAAHVTQTRQRRAHMLAKLALREPTLQLHFAQAAHRQEPHTAGIFGRRGRCQCTLLVWNNRPVPYMLSMRILGGRVHKSSTQESLRNA